LCLEFVGGSCSMGGNDRGLSVCAVRVGGRRSAASDSVE